MSAGYAILISLGACALAAALEGVCAGKNVKSYFAKLRFPAFSAPLWVWYIIGGLYYAIFFLVIYRILTRGDDSALKHAALALIFFMMIVNALWNYIFFRARNLFLSFIVASLFPLMDIALFICLIQLDKVAAWSLIPYLLYRIYALWWGYGLWKLNGRAA
ncbi:MAG TPA: TspO/MBR family protein [Pyrinomonadaceae bacterium]